MGQQIEPEHPVVAYMLFKSRSKEGTHSLHFQVLQFYLESSVYTSTL